jgi:uncharacterized protein
MNSPIPFTLSISPQLLAFLGQQTTLTLATVNPDGTPQGCDVFYAQDDALTFYFLSDPKTAHIRNLQRDPRVGATIHGSVRGWQDIRGVQLAGTAGRVDDPVERARGFGIYLLKYVFVAQWLPDVAALGRRHAQFGTVELYRLTPSWVRWLDNTQGFGHKEEWNRDDSRGRV